MKKYLEIAKITLKELFEYRFNVVAGALMSIFRILLAYFLWQAIFQEKAMIGDFTFSMMLTYYILTSFFMRMNQSEGVMWQFAGEVKNGQFTKYVVRPVNPIGFFITKSLTKTFFILMINVVAFVVWIAVFRNYVVPPASLEIMLWVLFFLFGGIMIMIQTNYFISMMSFKLVEIGGFFYMTLNIIEFLSGALVPLSLLPAAVVGVIKYFPYYYTLYFPASLYLNMNATDIPTAIAAVIAWNVILISINALLYRRLFRYYEGVGA